RVSPVPTVVSSSVVQPLAERSDVVREPEHSHAQELAEDRHRLFRAIADARDETARYRQLLIDLESNTPPPLLDGPGSPDDLKLIRSEERRVGKECRAVWSRHRVKDGAQ